MYLSKLARRKIRSKKGFSLVESLCAIAILALVTVGVLNAVAFSREMVFTNNERDQASDKAQLVADELFSIASSVDPNGTDAYRTIEAKLNAFANDTTGVQNAEIGGAKCVTSFSTPANQNEYIQYILTPIVAAQSTDIKSDITVTIEESTGKTVNMKAPVHDVIMEGWDIQVRVYYKHIGSDDLRCVDVIAYAPNLPQE